MTRILSRRAALAFAALAITIAPALPGAAQQQSPGTRIAGQITQADGDKLSIKGDNGQTVAVLLSADASVTNVVPAHLADIKAGRFVGTAAEPEANNRWRATEVHIFPPGARNGEGHYPWNTGRDATMTNADVAAAAVKAGNGTMTLATGGQNYDFDVPPTTPIVAMTPGTRALVKKGAQVSIFRAQPGSAAGSYTANAITVITARNWPPK
ncbi:MAG TPA: hypothetical protein VGP48_05805 [Stellaceae bacterium]|nr:hypothetical protein [Stellaceae bacterium]